MQNIAVNHLTNSSLDKSSNVYYPSMTSALLCATTCPGLDIQNLPSQKTIRLLAFLTECVGTLRNSNTGKMLYSVTSLLEHLY